jgi:hypothetical protein
MYPRFDVTEREWKNLQSKRGPSTDEWQGDKSRETKKTRAEETYKPRLLWRPVRGGRSRLAWRRRRRRFQATFQYPPHSREKFPGILPADSISSPPSPIRSIADRYVSCSSGFLGVFLVMSYLFPTFVGVGGIWGFSLGVDRRRKLQSSFG